MSQIDSPPLANHGRAPPKRRARPAPARMIRDIPAFPNWARIGDAARDPGDVGFFAGAALAVFDGALRSGADGGEPLFSGVLRQRLALRCAAAAARLLRLREDEAALRDAEHLAVGPDPGPAGRLYRLWRDMASGRIAFSHAGFAEARALLSMPQGPDDTLPADFFSQPGLRAGDPLSLAAQAANRLAAALDGAPRAEADILSYWAADHALAAAFGWARPVPLIAAQIHTPALRSRFNGRRPTPRDPEWPQALAVAYALAAQEAHRSARELTRGADKLLCVAPKLRAKGAAKAVALLLADDCASAARAARATGLSDRAARRFFDRLMELGAVRELTGRPNFRLYGL